MLQMHSRRGCWLLQMDLHPTFLYGGMSVNMFALVIQQKTYSQLNLQPHVTSLYKSKESLCVCVCLKYLCRSGSDWNESFNMAAAWFKGVKRWICLDYNDTVNKLFHKVFTDSASIVNHSHHSRLHSRANHCRAHPQDTL